LLQPLEKGALRPRGKTPGRYGRVKKPHKKSRPDEASDGQTYLKKVKGGTALCMP
jgi:hypothetical protein